MKRKFEQVIITAITASALLRQFSKIYKISLFPSSPTPFDASYFNLQADEIDKSFLCPCYSLNGYIRHCTVHVFDMPHRNRIALEHRERMIRAFEDDNEDYLLVADTLGVNRSTSIGIVLITDTAAIYYGCPGGARSVFTLAFWAKRELHMISREKGDHYCIQTWHNYLFFFHYNLFIGKSREKLA